MKKLPVINFIFQVMRPFRWQIVGLLFVACYWAVHISLQPYVFKLILDSFNSDPDVANFMQPIIFYIVITITFNLNFRFYDFVSCRLYPRLKSKIISEGIEKISHYPYSFYQNQLSGNISNKIKELSQSTVEFIQMLLDRFFSHVLALLIASATLMMVNPLLALILLMAAGALVLISFISTSKARLFSHQLTNANSALVGTIVDRFANMLNVLLFTSSNHEAEVLQNKLEEVEACDKRLRWHLLKVMSFNGFIMVSMVGSILLILAFNVQSRRITVGDFALVITLMLSILDVIFYLTQDLMRFSTIYGAVNQGVELLNHKFLMQSSDTPSNFSISKGEIRVENICFTYPDARILFNNESFIFKSGERVGLVGPSGSGKSTLLNLILGLFEPQAGNIFIDNQDIAKVNKEILRREIAMIPQDPVLFHRSILDNIRYAKQDACDDEVKQAASLSQAHDFIIRLPEGYNTIVGERGVKLSGGQRQRIAIARAILKNAPILLMDEATSALDSTTELLIKNRLFDIVRAKTIIVIAHRLSTILTLDRILVLDQGKLVENGSHVDLLKNNNLYKTLWDAQVGGFIPSLKSEELKHRLPEIASL